VGPFVGQVTQEFLNDVDFVNAVELFGAVRLPKKKMYTQWKHFITLQRIPPVHCFS
jgi:hypothetical protein